MDTRLAITFFVFIISFLVIGLLLMGTITVIRQLREKSIKETTPPSSHKLSSKKGNEKIKNFLFILFMFFLFSGFGVAILMLYAKYGDFPDKKTDAQLVCPKIRSMVKSSLSLSEIKFIYENECKIKKITAPLPGRFYNYKPHAITWSNGVAVRFFEIDDRLKVVGISKNGIPFSWNDDHKPIEKDISIYIDECKRIFIDKVNAKSIKLISSEKYSDFSGAKVEIEYIDEERKKLQAVAYTTVKR